MTTSCDDPKRPLIHLDVFVQGLEVVVLGWRVLRRPHENPGWGSTESAIGL